MKKLVYFALVGFWLIVLAGFTSTGAWVGLSIVGAGLAVGGFSMSRDALPVINEGVAYFAVFIVGILLLFGALGTMSPGLPGSWLTTTSAGLSLLENRSKRLKAAIAAKDPGLAARLASRGLGTDSPYDTFGRPLLLGATDNVMVAALLAAGLSPDAADGDGRTMAMLTYDEEIVASLLRAGADPDVTDGNGRSALSYAINKSRKHVELLLEADADVYAIDDGGISVADNYPASGPLRELLESHARAGALPPPREFTALDRGRTDWLSPANTPLPSSSLVLTPQDLHAGDSATLDITLGNDSTRDRLLEVRAELGGEAYFIEASHGGRIRNPGLFPLSQTIRWPLLALPAGRGGKLQLDIVARNYERAGDLTVDLRYRSMAEFDTQTNVQSGASTQEDVLTISESLKDLSVGSDGLRWQTFLFPLGFFAVLYLGFRALVRAKKNNVMAVTAVVSTIGAGVLALVAASLIFSLAEPWINFQETSCKIHDRRIELKESTSSSSGSGRTGSRKSSSVIYAQPVAAVRYAVDGQEFTTTGFGSGAITHSVNEFRNLPLGATVPCWVDTGQPTRFTLNRNLNAAAVVSLLLLLSTAMALALVARAIRRKGQDGQK